METEITIPCTECGAAVAADIHTEELGMCVECSHAYYTHDDEVKR